VNDLSERFWSASVEEMKQGFVYESELDQYVCLICGQTVEVGVIYPHEGVLYEASRYIKVHMEHQHGSVFAYLLGLGKKVTGLTDLQRTLLGLFHEGLSDNEIVKQLDGGSTSTIRNHRFTLREKEKQAKVYLALMSLAEAKTPKRERLISVPRTATVVDERFAMTEAENDEILATYFPDGPEGELKEFPKKEKRKIAILRHLTRKFTANRRYTEQQVNEILGRVFPSDPVVLRRYLIEYGLLKRKADGSEYWVNL